MHIHNCKFWCSALGCLSPQCYSINFIHCKLSLLRYFVPAAEMEWGRSQACCLPMRVFAFLIRIWFFVSMDWFNTFDGNQMAVQVRFISECFVLFHWCIYESLCQDHSLVYCSYLWRDVNLKLLQHWPSFLNYLHILDPLQFHINLWIHSWISTQWPAVFWLHLCCVCRELWEQYPLPSSYSSLLSLTVIWLSVYVDMLLFLSAALLTSYFTVCLIFMISHYQKLGASNYLSSTFLIQHFFFIILSSFSFFC